MKLRSVSSNKKSGLKIKSLKEVVQNLGDVQEVYLTGELAQGKPSKEISLILVGNPDRAFLTGWLKEAECDPIRKFSISFTARREFDERGFSLKITTIVA